WVNWSAQFIPPHVMKRISQTPIGRLLYGQQTVGYWTSVGAKIARIIQNMDFEGTLRQAQEARLAGNTDKAEALEYCATMARHALEDGVLLTYNQQLADDYLKGGLQRLFDKYHLKYDDDRRHLPIPAKIAKRTQDYRDTLRQRLQRANAITDPKKRMAALAAVAASPLADLYRTALWEPSGFLSEYQSMMVKLAGWAYLHHESAAGTLPPLPTDPTGNTASQGATPVARQGAPFSVLRSPFSGGGEAASSGAYDAARRRQIALYAADRAGDPNFANKGILLGQLEAFFTGFLNARMKGLSRTAARFKEAPGEFSLKALASLGHSLAQTVIIGGYATKILRDLLFDGQEPDEDQQNTAGGILYNNVKWMQDALKNVSPYTRLNYVVNPRVSNETSRLGGKVWGSKPLRFRKKMWTYAESGPWEEWILKFGSWGGWGGGRCRGVGIVLYYRHELDEATVCEEGVAAGVSGGGRDVGGGGLPNPAQGVGGGPPA
ncbi:MAG TPA: hypothetical protein IAC79_07505, partial [Candidatus Spyradenecus faecavium]|nr:hypothetical protein [Candidatus Spyradenecus faecavium]